MRKLKPSPKNTPKIYIFPDSLVTLLSTATKNTLELFSYIKFSACAQETDNLAPKIERSGQGSYKSYLLLDLDKADQFEDHLIMSEGEEQ